AAGDLFTDIVVGKVVDVEGVIGTDFDDLLMTDLSDNSLDGGLGDDVLRGRKGRDTMTGGDGNDELDGGKGRDRMEAGDGDDLLIGRRGLDNMRGGTGNDTLDGGTSDDILVGGRGNDVLIGAQDNDTIQGNQGDDVFVFADGHGVDIVLDFEATNDNEKLDFSGLSSISDIVAFGLAASQVGADVLIDTGGGKSILLENVDLGQLDAADFIF
ncbi:calcium-binding protein, partial [Marimonas lutisalis]|uniref:calcium-binding protein n=1 Tax=Marimonas lutisalis TaxID=2545756 RepID=UPI0010F645A8